ncbi:MAG: pyridoxine 5'-phosphate synthase [Deltaproteobacteria bacterium]|nr:pyridoxine 5'-phosphate synthase [Deltaproteobacteria bacterium]
MRVTVHRRPRLGVNVDHVATVRQARRARYPDPVDAALVAERAGADLITVHLREDRRHVQERDVRILREVAQTKLNLEMAATAAMATIARSIRPDTSTLVPERREELTTEGGLDIVGQREAVRRVVESLGDAGIRVSLFVDPDPSQLEASLAVGARAVEIHTGRYADAKDALEAKAELHRIEGAAKAAVDLGLEVAAGHGLSYTNTTPVAQIPEIEELNIGHSIVARAMIDGMDRAVRDMIALMERLK